MNKLPSHQLTDADIEEMLKDCIIFFDTSALFEMYKYSLMANQGIKNLLFTEFESQLWTSSQVIYEFYYNKNYYVNKSKKTYSRIFDDGVVKFVKDAVEQKGYIRSYVGKLKDFKDTYSSGREHPYFETPELNKITPWFDEFLNENKKLLENQEQKFREIVEAVETYRDQQFEKIKRIDNQICETVGLINKTDEYTTLKLNELSKEAEFRFANKIPPGFADADEDSKNGPKPGYQKFSDYFIWADILKLAEEKKLPLLLVSLDSQKGDWNLEPKTPHPSLVREYGIASGGKQFWKIDFRDFLKHAIHVTSDEMDVNRYLSTEIRLRLLEDIISNTDFSDDLTDLMLDYMINEYDEGNDFEIVEISVSQESINSVALSDFKNANLELTLLVEAEGYYADYWGRDEDTGEAVTSPPNTNIYQGFVDVVISINMNAEEIKEMEYKVNPTVEEINIISDSISVDTTTWDEHESWTLDP